MNPTRKTILIIYTVFVALFVLQISQKKDVPAPQSFEMTSDARSYTLPKTPVVSFVNRTEKTISLDTCRDIKVVTNGLQKSALPQALCRMHDIAPGTTQVLFGNEKGDIEIFQKSFSEISRIDLQFIYEPQDATQLASVTMSIEKAGMFRLFFRTFFYNPVYNLFAALVLLFPNYSLGWAIIGITLIIRLALLVPQQRMLVSQRKMQTIQPKIKAIQEEFKGDQAKIGMKMMELYKKEGVNPLGSCLPILIQIPILIVLYQVILNISNPSNFAHLYDFSWLQNFRTIALSTEFFGLHLEKSGGAVGIILGLVTGGLQFGQMWLSQRKMKTLKEEKVVPAKENMPDMQQMQKMMLYVFPAMAALFAYQFPAGVGLYWLIGTLFMIVQQFVANRQADTSKLTIRDKSGKILQG